MEEHEGSTDNKRVTMISASNVGVDQLNDGDIGFENKMIDTMGLQQQKKRIHIRIQTQAQIQIQIQITATNNK